MPRNQRAITKAQVRFQMSDCRFRIHNLMDETMNAKTEQEYNQSLAELNKAANDYNSWRMVLKSL